MSGDKYVQSILNVAKVAQECIEEKNAVIAERDEEIGELKSILYRSTKHMRHECEGDWCRCGFQEVTRDIRRVLPYTEFPQEKHR